MSKVEDIGSWCSKENRSFTPCRRALFRLHSRPVAQGLEDTKCSVHIDMTHIESTTSQITATCNFLIWLTAYLNLGPGGAAPPCRVQNFPPVAAIFSSQLHVLRCRNFHKRATPMALTDSTPHKSKPETPFPLQD